MSIFTVLVNTRQGPSLFCRSQLRCISRLFCASVVFSSLCAFCMHERRLFYYFLRRKLARPESVSTSLPKSIMDGLIQSCIQIFHASDGLQVFCKVFKQVKCYGSRPSRLVICRNPASLTLEVIQTFEQYLQIALSPSWSHSLSI